MYNPPSFKRNKLNDLHNFIEKYNFATLITNSNKGLVASHIPLLLDRSRGSFGTLIGHFARANPHFKSFQKGEDILCIFYGPHTYISAAWYVEEIDVPTWNYTVVHARGRAKIFEDNKDLERIVQATVKFHERNRTPPWTFKMPDNEKTSLMKAIVGFEIKIKEIEGKFKLSQNRTQKDRLGVMAGLSSQQDENSQAILAMMKEENENL
jgi:transcriptional regulator